MDSYDAWLQYKAECCGCDKCGREDHFEKQLPGDEFGYDILCRFCHDDCKMLLELYGELL